jgi:DNA-binding NarL/FixJ family response regulator
MQIGGHLTTVTRRMPAVWCEMDQQLSRDSIDSNLRIFIADDHPVVLSGLKALLATEPNFEIVGEASDGPTALQLAIELQPDVALFDLSMPGLNGIEIIKKYLAAHPKARVVVVSVQEDAVNLRRLLKLGVSGYILKRSATAALIRGIHAVASGGIYLDPAIAVQAVNRVVTTVPPGSETNVISLLSSRELQVLRLASVGDSSKVISAKLQVGPKSVETYKARGMQTLGFTKRIELIRFAISAGWLEQKEF